MFAGAMMWNEPSVLHMPGVRGDRGGRRIDNERGRSRAAHRHRLSIR